MDPYLFVDQTTCRSSIDGSDDIYLIIFRGSTEAPFSSSMSIVHPSAFSDFDDGESRGNDIQLARYFDNRVYVVALVERDADNDFLDNNGRALDLMRAQSGLAWVTTMGGLALSGSARPSAAQRERAAEVVATAINGVVGLTTTWPVGDDDAIGGARYLRITPGQEPTLRFREDGGDYSIRFKIKSH
jgi:hypothetical protein